MTLRTPELPEGISRLDAALAWAEAGWPVLPIAPGVKRPGSIVGNAWESQASRDPAVIRGWFSGPAGERRGVGICPGPAGGIVLDIDNPEHPAAPEVTGPSAESRPGTDRRHLFFEQPKGRKIGCPRVEWGDVRGWGGFVMVAPSLNPDNGNVPYGVPTPGRVPTLPAGFAKEFPDRNTYEMDRQDVEDAWRTLYGREWDGSDRYLPERIMERFQKEAPGGRHAALVDVTTWAMKAAWSGKIDPIPVLSELRREFLSMVTVGDGARDHDTATIEFESIVAYAVSVAEFESVAPEIQREVMDDGTVVHGPWRAEPAENLETAERLPELIADTLPPVGVGQIIGVTYVGKTFITVDLVYSLAYEQVSHWFGREILTHGGTAYWLLEGKYDFGLRSRAWKIRHGVTGPPDHPVHVITGPGKLTVPENQERFCALVREAFAEDRLGLVVVDTQSLGFAELNENDNSEMTQMLAACKTISEALGAPVLLIHHASDKGEGVNRKDPGRGASAQRAGMDFVFYAERKQPDPGAQSEPGKIQLTKYKPYRPWTRPELYDFAEIALGEDANGRPLVSAAIVPAGEGGRYSSTPVNAGTRALDARIMRAAQDGVKRGVKGWTEAVNADGGEQVDYKAVENAVGQRLGPKAGEFLIYPNGKKFGPMVANPDKPYPLED